MSANKNITANFTPIVVTEYRLTTSAVNGTLSISPNQVSYAPGTVVTITAIPNPGYTLAYWSGDVAGQQGRLFKRTSSTVTVTMNGNKNIGAYFVKGYKLTVTAVNGTAAINPQQETYQFASIVRLTATPMPGYAFAGWSGSSSSKSPIIAFYMLRDMNLTANFVPISVAASETTKNTNNTKQTR